MRIVLAIALLVGCRRPISAAEQSAFDDAESAWGVVGLPDSGECLDGARVHVASSDEFLRRCLVEPKQAHACLSTYDGGFAGRRKGWLVVVAPGSEITHRVIVHEALHALTACTLGRADVYDGGHADPRVWESGGPNSAESLASLLVEDE